MTAYNLHLFFLLGGGGASATNLCCDWFFFSIYSFQENLLKNPTTGRCLQLKGGQIQMDNCNAADLYQHWTFSWPPN